MGGAGTQTAGLSFGGATPSLSATTEEYNVSSSVITAAAWASGGNMNTSRYAVAGAGTQTATVAAGGQSPTYQ